MRAHVWGTASGLMDTRTRKSGRSGTVATSPHCTVQTDDQWIIQLPGRANGQPSTRYWPAIHAFIAWFKPERFDDAIYLGRFFAEGKLWPSPDAFFEDVTASPCTVRGDMYLTVATVARLPDGLHVKGNVFLNGASITHLPQGLYVDGDLYLRYTPITCLPEGIHVSGSLDIPRNSDHQTAGCDKRRRHA